MRQLYINGNQIEQLFINRLISLAWKHEQAVNVAFKHYFKEYRLKALVNEFIFEKFTEPMRVFM